jgi:hypothetical protein
LLNKKEPWLLALGTNLHAAGSKRIRIRNTAFGSLNFSTINLDFFRIQQKYKNIKKTKFLQNFLYNQENADYRDLFEQAAEPVLTKSSKPDHSDTNNTYIFVKGRGKYYIS